MFRVLPKDAALDDLWRAGLVYSRPATEEPDEWTLDAASNVPPSTDPSKWEYAIFIEE